MVIKWPAINQHPSDEMTEIMEMSPYLSLFIINMLLSNHGGHTAIDEVKIVEMDNNLCR